MGVDFQNLFIVTQLIKKLSIISPIRTSVFYRLYQLKRRPLMALETIEFANISGVPVVLFTYTKQYGGRGEDFVAHATSIATHLG